MTFSRMLCIFLVIPSPSFLCCALPSSPQVNLPLRQFLFPLHITESTLSLDNHLHFRGVSSSLQHGISTKLDSPDSFCLGHGQEHEDSQSQCYSALRMINLPCSFSIFWVLGQIYCSRHVFFCGVNLKFNQTTVSYPYNICAVIVQRNISFQTGHETEINIEKIWLKSGPRGGGRSLISSPSCV